MQLQACIIEDLGEEELDDNQLSHLLRRIPAAVMASREFCCHECGHTYDNPWPPLTMKTENSSEESDVDIFDDFCPLEGDVSMEDSDDLPSSMDISMGDVSMLRRTSGSWNCTSREESGCEESLSQSVPTRQVLPHCISPIRTFDKWGTLRSFMSSRDDLEDHSPSSRSPSAEEDIWRQHAEQTLVCMHSRHSFHEDILGYGMNTTKKPESGKVRSIFSSMDYISYTAFYDFNHHESVDGTTQYAYWFPLYINEEHGARAAEKVEDSISMILTNQRGLFEPEMVLHFLSQVMCNLMIDVITKKIHASDKALAAYLCFHRWMLYFVNKYPQLLRTANQTVNNFVASERERHKDVVSSLGCFLALLSVSDLTWHDVSEAYLQEAYDRNVLWVLGKSPNLAKAAHKGTPFTPEDTQEFFNRVIPGKKLVVFHVYFLKNVGRREELSLHSIASHYDETYGLSTKEKTNSLREFCKSIDSIDSWRPFYAGVGKTCPSHEVLGETLQQAIRNSERRGYHDRGIIFSKKRCWKYQRRGYCPHGDNCRFAHVKGRVSKSPWME